MEHPAPHRDAPKALESGASGKVVLRCVIIDGGAVSSCVVVSETPAGQGFGREALRGIRTARAQPGQEGTREITLIFATH
ncbi:TonB family protein [Brevundimonas intermedia]|uniref:TonB family protein n=1 Tax=Brevundimonas intermedia TaxID=74315 RepID=UPI0022F288AA|nr:TonB family protein [Brevundimonas intermedia]